MKLIVMTTVLTLAASTAMAEDTYLVSSEIIHKDQVLGAPTMLVPANNTASMEAGDSYKLSFIIKPNDQKSVLISTNLDVAGDSYSPALLVNIGEQASIAMDDTKLSMTVTRHTK